MSHGYLFTYTVLTGLQDHDQRITRADLIHAMTQMGYESSTETADSILREVDFGRKGYVEFQEYLDVSPKKSAGYCMGHQC